MAMSGTRKAILIIGGIFAVLILVVGVGVLSLWLAFRKTGFTHPRQQRADAACRRDIAGLYAG